MVKPSSAPVRQQRVILTGAHGRNGLGAVSQNIAANALAPSSPLVTTTNPVTVTIQGIPAQVLFAGLAPGFAGLYQVNVMVPAGLAASSSAPLVITVAGQSSPPALITVQ